MAAVILARRRGRFWEDADDVVRRLISPLVATSPNIVHIAQAHVARAPAKTAGYAAPISGLPEIGISYGRVG